jgi:hypothetical protein
VDSFISFKNLTEIVKKYELFYDLRPIIPEARAEVLLPKLLNEQIQFNLTETIYDASEAAICESIIYPILQEVWKEFKDRLQLWSHTGIDADETLAGILDYVIAKKSEFGRILGTPLLATIEAKKDNFDEGWTQCTAQLLAMQKLNQKEQDYVLYGIVSNGEQWEFGQLHQNKLLRHPKSFSVFELSELYTVIHHVLSRCYEQVK